MMNHPVRPALLAAALGSFALAACSTLGTGATPFSQDALPDAVKVPAGHRVQAETVGVGEITYECRLKVGSATEHEWFFAGPKAELRDRKGQVIGRYYGPPATWESNDGSKVTGAQLAVAPAGAGNIPLQLVKANPTGGAGAMQGISHIQRVATRGGVAPATACGPANLGQRQQVAYQADYIYWKPAVMAGQ